MQSLMTVFEFVYIGLVLYLLCTRKAFNGPLLCHFLLLYSEKCGNFFFKVVIGLPTSLYNTLSTLRIGYLFLQICLLSAG